MTQINPLRSQSNADDIDTGTSAADKRREHLDTQMVDFRRQVVVAVSITLAIIALLLLAYTTSQVLFLLFISLLVAIALRSTSHSLAKRSFLSESAALGVVGVTILVLIVLAGIFVAPRLADQVEVLADELPRSLERIESQLEEYSWGQAIVDRIPDRISASQIIRNGDGNVFGRATGILSSTLGLISNAILVLFTALFFALEPKTYVRGIAQLMPPSRRDQTEAILMSVGDTLWQWLITRFFSMVLIGTLTTVGLLLIGLPLALILGVFAGLLAFIPTFGPIIALIPPLLLAFSLQPESVVLVLALYLGVQMIDNYIVTPIVVKQTVRIPPAIIIAAQLLVGVIFGSIGLVLAAPFAVLIMRLVQKIYVQGYLEQNVDFSRDNNID